MGWLNDTPNDFVFRRYGYGICQVQAGPAANAAEGSVEEPADAVVEATSLWVCAHAHRMTAHTHTFCASPKTKKTNGSESSLA